MGQKGAVGNEGAVAQAGSGSRLEAVTGELGCEDGGVLSANIYQDVPMNLADHTLRRFCLLRWEVSRWPKRQGYLGNRFEEQDYWKGGDSGQQKPAWLVPH